MTNKVFLKVKLKTLAEEAKVIRKEEKRHNGDLRENLYLHRIHKVRPAARSTHLAYGYIRGRAYRQIEVKAKTVPNWKEVERMVKQYGNNDFKETWYKRPAP